MFFLRIILILSLLSLLHAKVSVKIGAFFEQDDAESIEVFNTTISHQNAFNDLFRLEPIIKTIESMDGFRADQEVCEMVKSDVVAIFGPRSIYVSDIVASICNELNIPHLVSYHRIPEISKNPYHNFTRNIYPDPNLISKALVDVVQNYKWKRFAIVYDSDESLIRLNGVLQLFESGYKAVTVYKFPGKGKEKVQKMLKDIAKTNENRVILDCSVDNIAEIIKQGVNTKSISLLMGEYMSYLITTPDGHMINQLNIPEMNEVMSNITAIRLTAAKDIGTINILDQWEKRNLSVFNNDQYQYKNQISSDNYSKIDAALVRDAVTVLYTALTKNKLFERIYDPPTPPQCNLIDDRNNDGSLQWERGIELLSNIDNKVAYGISGPINFDKKFQTRMDINMSIVELDKHVFTKVAEWSVSNGLTVTRNMDVLQQLKEANIQNKTFRVFSRLEMPFLQRVVSNVTLSGNDQFEGFAKDLIDEIAKLKNFTYVLDVVPDCKPGHHDPTTDKWNGLVGMILDGKADLAVADLTITYDRKLVIDFSAPFMNLGISILYVKPFKEDIKFDNFLKPLHPYVWFSMSTAFLLVSLAIYVLAKINEADWESPHPCDDEPQELENVWNMHNCIWLTVGSIVQQGCDILPKGFPTRLMAAVWWFFALIVISSYTANMAAFLTKEQMEETIKSVEDLAKDSKIQYGIMRGGSTEAFFMESNVSLHQKMWAHMLHADPSVFEDSNEKGVKRVSKSYAFLMESAMIDYETRRECHLMRIGNWLDSKSYGIGMPMNSPYRDEINEALLKLKEGRRVHNLTEKWWKEKNVKKDGKKCETETEEESDTPDLDIAHVKGVFLVLLIGIGLAVLIGVLEFCWNVRKVSISQKITPHEAFRRELLFACKFWITRKPVLESRDSESLSSSSSSERHK